MWVQTFDDWRVYSWESWFKSDKGIPSSDPYFKLGYILQSYTLYKITYQPKQ